MFNAKFDVQAFYSLGRVLATKNTGRSVELRRFWHDGKFTLVDVMTISDITDRTRGSLKERGLFYGIEGAKEEETKIKEMMAIRNHPDKYYYLSPEEISDYACLDTELTFEIYLSKGRQLLETYEAHKVFEFEMSVTKNVIDMEQLGVKVNTAELERQIAVAEELRDRFQATANYLAGEEIDTAKAANIVKVMKKLGVDLEQVTADAPGVQKENAKKIRAGKKPIKVSTTKEVLKLCGHPIGPVIIDLKAVNKLLSTYLHPYRSLLDKNDRVHTSYFTNGAITGRFSSSKPNLQNLKRDTLRLVQKFDEGDDAPELAKKITIKNIFVAEVGFTLYALDYSQVEYRGFSVYAACEKMKESFRAGLDLHQVTADAINSMLGEGTCDRSAAKCVNFGILYCIGAKGLAGLLGKSSFQTDHILSAYHKTYPEAKAFVDKVMGTGMSRGFVRNLYGRRYDCPTIITKAGQKQRAMAYKLVNYLIQGSCAAMMKEKLIACAEFLRHGGYRSRLILTVHDELIFEIADNEKHIVQKLAEIMEDFRSDTELRKEIKLPITVSVEASLSGLGDTVEVDYDMEYQSDDEVIYEDV